MAVGQSWGLFCCDWRPATKLPSASSGPELVEGGRVGGRCPFHGVSMGETAALSHSTLLMALSKIEGPVEGNAGGGKTPPLIRCRKDKAGSLGIEEKAS
jgi:hypothetical protein